MSSKSIVQIALNIRWLESQGVPDLRAIRIRLHYGPEARVGSESPYTDPYVGWSGTRGCLS